MMQRFVEVQLMMLDTFSVLPPPPPPRKSQSSLLSGPWGFDAFFIVINLSGVGYESDVNGPGRFFGGRGKEEDSKARP